QSLRLDTPDNTHFTAPWMERVGGETTIFYNGTYTACKPCFDQPDKPPTWQIKAKKIIHQNEEQTIYYEDATFELWGLPIIYLPYFSTPDPSVKKKTGFLAPRYYVRSQLGFGVGTPFFWNLAPNYDLTLTPNFFTKQGFLGEIEWRHKIFNGS